MICQLLNLPVCFTKFLPIPDRNPIVEYPNIWGESASKILFEFMVLGGINHLIPTPNFFSVISILARAFSLPSIVIESNIGGLIVLPHIATRNG